MRRSKSKILLTCGGLLLIAAALFLAGRNLWQQYRADRSVEAAMSQLAELIPEPGSVDASAAMAGLLPELGTDLSTVPDYVLNPEKEMPTVTVGGNEYIGYITIPALELDLPVLSEWSYPKLNVSPCRYVGSVYLGNMVVCAHNFDKHFGRLKNLEEGELVQFTDAEGNVFTYSVSAMEQLNRTDIDEMVTGDWDLSLFTCTVGGLYRVTVRCTLTQGETERLTEAVG